MHLCRRVALTCLLPNLSCLFAKVIHSTCADCSHVEDKKWIKNCKWLRALHHFTSLYIAWHEGNLSFLYLFTNDVINSEQHPGCLSQKSHEPWRTPWELYRSPLLCSNRSFPDLSTSLCLNDTIVPTVKFKLGLLISSYRLYGLTASAMETFITNLQPTSVFSLVCLMTAFFKVPSRWISFYTETNVPLCCM